MTDIKRLALGAIMVGSLIVGISIIYQMQYAATTAQENAPDYPGIIKFSVLNAGERTILHVDNVEGQRYWHQIDVVDNESEPVAYGTPDHEDVRIGDRLVIHRQLSVLDGAKVRYSLTPIHIIRT